jgi:hypothetical protein
MSKPVKQQWTCRFLASGQCAFLLLRADQKWHAIIGRSTIAVSSSFEIVEQAVHAWGRFDGR